jgi:Arc/MetJ-type ribon-helix-helix transcriptional regulator
MYFRYHSHAAGAPTTTTTMGMSTLALNTGGNHCSREATSYGNELIIDLLYDKDMQIAVVVPDAQVLEIDRLIPSFYRSRAEVVRIALDDLLSMRRRLDIDQRYLAGLDATADDDAPIRLRPGDPEPSGWAEIPW